MTREDAFTAIAREMLTRRPDGVITDEMAIAEFLRARAQVYQALPADLLELWTSGADASLPEDSLKELPAFSDEVRQEAEFWGIDLDRLYAVLGLHDLNECLSLLFVLSLKSDEVYSGSEVATLLFVASRLHPDKLDIMRA